MEAEIIIEYRSTKEAEVVAKAVSPDNFKTPLGLSINTDSRGRKVFTHIRCTRKIPTFIATIDDLLFSVTTAEKILKTIKSDETAPS